MEISHANGIAIAMFMCLIGCVPSDRSVNERVQLTQNWLKSSEDVFLEGKIECVNNQVVFSYLLKNRADRDIFVSSASLPWDTNALGNSWEVKMISSGAAVSRGFFGEDHAPGPILLSPGESMRGALNLAILFPSLPQAVRAGDVKIDHSYWLYLPKASQDGDFQEHVVILQGWCFSEKKPQH